MAECMHHIQRSRGGKGVGGTPPPFLPRRLLSVPRGCTTPNGRSVARASPQEAHGHSGLQSANNLSIGIVDIAGFPFLCVAVEVQRRGESVLAPTLVTAVSRCVSVSCHSIQPPFAGNGQSASCYATLAQNRDTPTPDGSLTSETQTQSQT